VSLSVTQFEINWNVSANFNKKHPHRISQKNHLVHMQIFHAGKETERGMDGWTDGHADNTSVFTNDL
jgi:hypothetical protein